MQERESFSNMRARLGTGGALIDIKGVNGRISFESDAPEAGASTTTITTVRAPAAPSADFAPPPAPPAPPAH
jgi:hypothetical protein